MSGTVGIARPSQRFLCSLILRCTTFLLSEIRVSVTVLTYFALPRGVINRVNGVILTLRWSRLVGLLPDLRWTFRLPLHTSGQPCQSQPLAA